MIGVFIVALGERARASARVLLNTLRLFHNWPVCLVSDLPFPGVEHFIPDTTHVPNGRANKVQMLNLCPKEWQYIVYLDADTRVGRPLDPAIQMLKDGWDIAIARSWNQGEQVFAHISEDEREKTFDQIGLTPLQLQAGVMFVRRSAQTERLFTVWHSEWQRWGDQDQAALVRALYDFPVKVFQLGHPWNGGAVVGHAFGMAR